MVRPAAAALLLLLATPAADTPDPESSMRSDSVTTDKAPFVEE